MACIVFSPMYGTKSRSCRCSCVIMDLSGSGITLRVLYLLYCSLLIILLVFKLVFRLTKSRSPRDSDYPAQRMVIRVAPILIANRRDRSTQGDEDVYFQSRRIGRLGRHSHARRLHLKPLWPGCPGGPSERSELSTAQWRLRAELLGQHLDRIGHDDARRRDGVSLRPGRARQVELLC